MRKLYTLIFFLGCLRAVGADPKYPVSSIPEEMKKGMYAVIREKSVEFEVISIDRSTETYRVVITILNKNAEDYASFSVSYDKFRSVDYIKGAVYDANGEQIKKLKNNEIIDRSIVTEGQLFDDNRIKYVDLSQSTYPYTVEYEYKIVMKFLYAYPNFILYNDDEVSIQSTYYTLYYPAELKPRIRMFKVNDPTKGVTKDGKESLVWAFKNVIPDKFEGSGPDLDKIIPNIKAAPVQFSYGGHEGRMDTWQNYGLWQASLNSGRDALPEATISTIKEIAGKYKTTEEKTKAIYEYVQNKTRYVGIQLGVGGLQPFEAKTVDEVGYGDCKGLSNYTVALLKAVGIKGYYSKVYGGEENLPVIPDFVDSYFNHIIVAVPNGADTLWLECTSQTNPFGYMGSFTGERKALMITEKGGVLVNTPKYADNKNVMRRSADISIEKTGDASGKVATTYSGLMYESGGLSFQFSRPRDDQKKWLQNHTSIPSFDLTSFELINRKDKIPSAVVKSEYILRRFATVSGKRMFITPNLMHRSEFIPQKIAARKTSLVMATGFVTSDTIRYRVPEDIYPEFLPEPVKLKTQFGEYEATFKYDQGAFLYVRRVRMNRGEFPASSYNEWVEFFKNINKADNIKLVFLNKT